jgi:DinB superfamily
VNGIVPRPVKAVETERGATQGGHLTAVVRATVQLRVLTDEPGTLAALTRIEDAQAALRQMLRPVEPSRLYERPPSGDWSPMENVRHLIFAEQHHFSPYLRGFRWRSAGVPPPNRTGERRLSPAGSGPASTVDEVFEVWAKVHAVVRARCLEAQDGLARSLEGDLHHLTIHAKVIERLLGA